MQSLAGLALVGMNADLWSRNCSISPKGDNADGRMVVCRDFKDPGTWGTGSKRLPLYNLSRENLRWFHVIGIFKDEAYFD